MKIKVLTQLITVTMRFSWIAAMLVTASLPPVERMLPESEGRFQSKPITNVKGSDRHGVGH